MWWIVIISEVQACEPVHKCTTIHREQDQAHCNYQTKWFPSETRLDPFYHENLHYFVLLLSWNVSSITKGVMFVVCVPLGLIDPLLKPKCIPHNMQAPWRHRGVGIKAHKRAQSHLNYRKCTLTENFLARLEIFPFSILPQKKKKKDQRQ